MAHLVPFVNSTSVSLLNIFQKVLLRGYCQGMLDRVTVEEVLEIGRSGFFTLLKEYRHDPDRFSFAYQRESLTIDSLSG